jgi:hypothetical protein
MLHRIISIVFPIFIIVMIGFAYGHRHRPVRQVASIVIIDNALALFFIPLALALRL